MMFTQKYIGPATIVFDGKNSYDKVILSVASTSSASATVTGTGTLGDGTISTPADIEAGQSLTIIRGGTTDIKFTLTIPSSCTVNVVAY